MDGLMDGLLDGLMDGWMDGWMALLRFVDSRLLGTPRRLAAGHNYAQSPY